MMTEPLSIKYIHKPARANELINEKSLNYRLNKNSQLNRNNERSDKNEIFHHIDFGNINNNVTNNNNITANDNASAIANANNLSGNGNSGIDKQIKGYKDDKEEVVEKENEEVDPMEDKKGYFGSKLVRKKSGEILKSSLKDKFISKSLPSTPNSKQVHFGTQSDIKFFRKKDKPNAISALNSPVLLSPNLDSVGFSDDGENSDYSDVSSDDEFSISSDYHQNHQNHHPNGNGLDMNNIGITNYPNPKHNKLIDWKLRLKNFKNLEPEHYNEKFQKHLEIFLERVFLSIDKKFLLGHIAVKNLSFEKNVSLKYSFNNWSTIIEIHSIYVPDFPKFLKDKNYDRFIFKIPLNDLFINNSNSFYQENDFKFCLKFKNNFGEYWDNNNFKNFEINIVKIIKNDNKTYQFNDSKNFHSNSFSEESPTKNRSFPPYNGFIQPSTTIGNGTNIGGLNSYSYSYPNSKSNSNTTLNSNSNISNSTISTISSPRPKYSNSYLKRINSDSQLDIDYVKNNYYLSSPLLSNFKYNHEHDNTSNDTLKINNNSNKNNLNNLNDLNDDLNHNPLNDNNNEIDKFKLSNMDIDSKSYQDLIDNYCFFNSDKKDDETFTVLSLLGS